MNLFFTKQPCFWKSFLLPQQAFFRKIMDTEDNTKAHPGTGDEKQNI